MMKPVLYTDVINDQQVCRDDLWLIDTAELRVFELQQAEIAAAHEEIDELQSKSSDTFRALELANEEIAELRTQQASAVTSQTVDRELSSSADGRGYSRDDEDWFFSPNDGD